MQYSAITVFTDLIGSLLNSGTDLRVQAICCVNDSGCLFQHTKRLDERGR